MVSRFCENLFMGGTKVSTTRAAIRENCNRRVYIIYDYLHNNIYIYDYISNYTTSVICKRPHEKSCLLCTFFLRKGYF